MSSTTLGRTWDTASSPEVVRLARQFEAEWRAGRGARPDPIDFLPDRSDARPGALLALLRIDLALRREAGEPVGVDWYRDRYPALGEETLVALIYEEFCLREEAGESPDPAEYEARFPDVAPRLREVFEIHGFLAECPSTAPHPPDPADDRSFPEAGQTIAGFRLIEELGRGSFARVFRAEERRLGDRPVVLKVARFGTREPQTLARLQHTHIVPVHSYLADPATGLHLLCMPYFGRLTLARALGNPAVAAARSGAELVAALERLQAAGHRPQTAAWRALAERTYPRAIAWLAARLAEALQHAHERGVLHRDLKPSNILLTDDGLPMLLDFNLACGPPAGRPRLAPEPVGGTLAYMAPEHLEALIAGHGGRIDHRADLYSLALIMLEALGSPPLGRPPESAKAGNRPTGLLDARKSGPPEPDEGGRSVPLALRAVLRRCLAPDPNHRYASAAELAADLHAVADAAPLRFAREPMASRLAGWARRHRLRIAVTIPIVLALVAALATWSGARADRLRRELEVRQLLLTGEQRLAEGDCIRAADRFDTAAGLADGWPGLRDLNRAARAQRERARAMSAMRDRADDLSRRADPVRFHLLGFGGDAASAARELEEALAAFGALNDAAWARRPELDLLDEARRIRLFEEVNELLFLWVVAVARDRLDDPEMARRAVGFCDRALAFAEPRGPWYALRDWWRRHPAGSATPGTPAYDPARESNPLACLQWGLLATLRKDRGSTLTWLERARFLRPDHYWHQYILAYDLERADDIEGALRHYEAAIALRPSAPWAWFNRAHLYAYRRGAWNRALRDLDRAVALAGERPLERARFLVERGKVRRDVGDVVGARADFAAAMAADPNGHIARAARLDQARLDAEAGATRQARSAYDALLESDPSDRLARLARARLALRQGRAAEAEADLTCLLSDCGDAAAPTRAAWLASRALARLALGRAAEAHADAEAAFRLDPAPGRVRLRARMALAAGRPLDGGRPHPDAIAGWPLAGPCLEADLRAALERLRAQASEPSDPTAAAALRARAANFSVLNDHVAATAEAERAVRRSASAASYTVLAEVRIRAGDRPGAVAAVESGLAAEPDDPDLLQLRGRFAIEAGDRDAGVRWLDRALFHGAAGPASSWKARALMALGRRESALEAWSAALAQDAEDPEAFLGRARCLRSLGLWENALADLEQAAERAPDGSWLLARVAFEYLAILPARSDRLPRVAALARRLLPETAFDR
jgi:serine/threonine protein kinase/predicted Zn-dependent protease